MQFDEPILSVSEAKRQHYVPRSYLRRFTGRDGKVRVVDMARSEEYRTSTSNAAVGNHFYDVQVEGVDTPVSPETWFAEIESNATPVIGQLLECPANIENLTQGEQFHLARFFTSLLFRTPSFGGGGEMSTHMLGESRGYSNLVLAMPWRIGYVAPYRLYTSDNPVSSYINPVRPWLDLDCFPAREYYLPLSPTLLLKVDRLSHADKSEGTRSPIGPRCKDDFSVGETVFAQWLTSAGASRFLYGEEKGYPKQLADIYLFLLNQLKINLSENQNGNQITPLSSYEMQDLLVKAVLTSINSLFNTITTFAPTPSTPSSST